MCLSWNFPTRTFIPDRTFIDLSKLSPQYVYSRPYVYISPQSRYEIDLSYEVINIDFDQVTFAN